MQRAFKTLTVLLLLLVIAQGGWGEEAGFKLPNNRIMVLGDSITQAHHWVSILDYYLQKAFPSDKIDIVGVGLSSETASGLSEPDHPFPRPCIHERLGRLLEKIHPDVVIACYGMNDGIYHPPGKERTKAYQDGMHQLIDRCRAAGVTHFILMTPPLFTPKANTEESGHSLPGPDTGVTYGHMNPWRAYDEVLIAYGQWLLTLDNSNDILVADTHGPMAAYQKQRRITDPSFSLSDDGIHPGFVGHLLMANAVLDRIGLRIGEGDPASQAKAVKADPLFELVDKRNRLLGDALRRHVGFIRNKEQTMTRSDNIDDELKRAVDLLEQIDLLR